MFCLSDWHFVYSLAPKLCNQSQTKTITYLNTINSTWMTTSTYCNRLWTGGGDWCCVARAMERLEGLLHADEAWHWHSTAFSTAAGISSAATSGFTIQGQSMHCLSGPFCFHVHAVAFLSMTILMPLVLWRSMNRREITAWEYEVKAICYKGVYWW